MNKFAYMYNPRRYFPLEKVSNITSRHTIRPTLHLTEENSDSFQFLEFTLSPFAGKRFKNCDIPWQMGQGAAHPMDSEQSIKEAQTSGPKKVSVPLLMPQKRISYCPSSIFSE